MFECLTCCFDVWYGAHLVCIHILFFCSWNFMFLCCSIPLDTSSFYQRFLGFSRNLLIYSPICRAFFFFSKLSTCLIEARHLSWYIKIFSRRYLLDTSLSIEILFSTPLDTSSIYRDAWIYIFLRFDLVHFSLKHFDLSLSSLSIQTLVLHQKPSPL